MLVRKLAIARDFVNAVFFDKYTPHLHVYGDLDCHFPPLSQNEAFMANHWN